MTVALALAAAVALVAFFVARKRRTTSGAEAQRESTPALEAWIVDTLEAELAQGALGLVDATPEERKKLASSLRGDPDPDVVGAVEDKVRAIEIEYTRYAHEADAEVLLRVRYDDGKPATATKRFAWESVPEGVREDFDRKKTSRVFRVWTFPWSRVRAL